MSALICPCAEQRAKQTATRTGFGKWENQRRQAHWPLGKDIHTRTHEYMNTCVHAHIQFHYVTLQCNTMDTVQYSTNTIHTKHNMILHDFALHCVTLH